jgi:hypothetical protein
VACFYGAETGAALMAYEGAGNLRCASEAYAKKDLQACQPRKNRGLEAGFPGRERVSQREVHVP